MKIILRGSKPLDFVSNDGTKVSGTKIFYSYASNGVSGEETAAFFVRAGMALPKLVVGSSYNADFNNQGKLIGLYEG